MREDEQLDPDSLQRAGVPELRAERAAPVAWSERVAFDMDKPVKAPIWSGERLFSGLNCFLPGQFQALHSHIGADKIYVVLRGSGVFQVGMEAFSAGAGAVVPAPARVPHGVRNDGPDPLVLLTVIAPPPRKG